MIWSLTWATASLDNIAAEGRGFGLRIELRALGLLLRGQGLVGLLLGEEGSGSKQGNQPAARRKHRNGEGS